MSRRIAGRCPDAAVRLLRSHYAHAAVAAAGAAAGAAVSGAAAAVANSPSLSQLTPSSSLQQSSAVTSSAACPQLNNSCASSGLLFQQHMVPLQQQQQQHRHQQQVLVRQLRWEQQRRHMHMHGSILCAAMHAEGQGTAADGAAAAAGEGPKLFFTREGQPMSRTFLGKLRPDNSREVGYRVVARHAPGLTPPELLQYSAAVPAVAPAASGQEEEKGGEEDEEKEEEEDEEERVAGDVVPSKGVRVPRKAVFGVVQVGSHQFKVSPGDVIYVEKLHFADVNDMIHLDRVLLLGSRHETVVGRPTLPDARVVALVEEHALDAKVIVFKKKRRKNYRRHRGHRQELTRLLIVDIEGIQESPPS